MDLVRIASTCAAIALLCLPARAADNGASTPQPVGFAPAATQPAGASQPIPAPESAASPTSPVSSPPAMRLWQRVTSLPVEASGAPSILIAEGTKWLQRNEYENAIKTFDKAVRLEHKNAVAYYCRGKAWYAKGDARANKEYYERAANDYSVAILLRPDFADAYRCLGDAYLKLERYELAIENQSEAVRRNERYSSSFADSGDAVTAPAGDHLAHAILPETDLAEAYRGRAAAHGELAKIYDQRKDLNAWRRELKNVSDDNRRASEIRPAGRDDSEPAIRSVQP